MGVTSGDGDLDADLADVDDSVAEALRELASAPRRAVPLSPGAVLGGHFRIERRIGAGGTGAVYLARDTELLRDVAIKVRVEALDPAALERLQDEARAMARLAHPNVLGVHELGTVDGRLYIAMEYIDGGTAAQWRDREPRRWSEILDVYLEAARGLNAAHQIGLVHRDFKPANVLVASDGRVKVADFGLAQLVGPSAGSRRTTGPVGAGTPSEESSVGTPAYMAPEQFVAGEVSPVADQFALGVSLFEALWGVRPFGESLAGNATDADRLNPPLDGAPAWLRTVLRRCTALDPSDRFESVEALLHEVEVQRRRPARRLMWLAGAAALGAAAIGGAQLGATQPDARRCEEARAPMEAAWTDDRRERIREAFAAASDAGETTSQRAIATLDAFADRWMEEREASCLATYDVGTQSERLLERSMACFSRAQRHFELLVDALGNADVDAVRHVDKALAGLPRLASCRAPNELGATVEPPSGEQAGAVEEIRTGFSHAAVQRHLGHWKASHDLMTGLLEDAEAVGYPPVVADALIGLTEEPLFPRAERRELLRRAYRLARGAGDSRTTFFAALSLAHRSDEVAIDEREAWTLVAAAEAEQPAASPLWGARVQAVEGWLLSERGRYDEAVARLEGAVADWQRHDGEPYGLAAVRLSLGAALEAAGRPREAIARYDEVIAYYESPYGPANRVALVPVLQGRGLARVSLGEYDAAIADMRQARERAAVGLGPDHVEVYDAELNLGVALLGAKQPQEAWKVLVRARDGLAAAGAADSTRALVLDALGYAELELGRHGDAAATFEEARALNELAYGRNHPQVAINLGHIADAALAAGDAGAAREACASAVAIWEALEVGDHPRRAEALVCTAEANLAANRPKDAAAAARDAIAIASRVETEPSLLPIAQFALARALAMTEASPTEALRIASEAHAAVADHDPELAGRIATWRDALSTGAREEALEGSAPTRE